MAKKVDLNDSVVEEYKNGKTLKELASANNCSPSKISEFLQSRGVDRRPRGRRKVNKQTRTDNFNANSTFTFPIIDNSPEAA